MIQDRVMGEGALRLPPSLNEGTCVVCLTAADTGFGQLGDADWIVAGLTALGTPMDEAIALFGVPLARPSDSCRSARSRWS